MIRLYLDEDVHKKIALSLRLKGYDVISAHEVKNQGIPDYKQLQYAISDQRAIFTFNIGDLVDYIKNTCGVEKNILGYSSQNRSHSAKLLNV